MRNILSSAWIHTAVIVAALVLLGAQHARSVYSSPVSVVNTPLPVSQQGIVNASGSAIDRVQLTQVAFADGGNFVLNDAHSGQPFTVPAGKRLVIEHASLFAYPGSGAHVFAYWWDGATYMALPVNEQSPGSFMGSIPMRDYVDPGQRVIFSIYTGVNSYFWDIHVNGYLVDCNGAC